MATETTSTTLTELVVPEIIAPLILDYAVDKWVIYPHVRVQSVKGSGTASFPAWVKDTASDVSSEGDTLSNNALDTTEVATITAAQVGILREVTDYAFETVNIGRDGLVDFIVQDGVTLLTEMLEDDLAALFTSASNSAGATGTDMGIADFVAAMAKLDTSKARGRRVCIVDDQQAVDLRTAVAASTATVFANASANAQSVLNASGDAYVGELFGVPIWLSNLTDTVNTAADVCGILMVDGAAHPQNAPIGVAMLWEPRVRNLYLPDQIGEQWAITAAWACGEISDFNYCKIVTDA